MKIPEECTSGLLSRITFVETVNRQLSIFEGFKRELGELKRCKMGAIDFNMQDKNVQLTNAIVGGKEGQQRGLINDLKNCVLVHKQKLGISLNAMINISASEIDLIEADETFSNPENLENLDKDTEMEVINK